MIKPKDMNRIERLNTPVKASQHTMYTSNDLGVQNTIRLEEALYGDHQKSYKYMGRPLGMANCILVAKRELNEWEWTQYMTDLLNGARDIRQFLHASLIQGQEKDVMNVIGNNLSSYPDVIGLVILKV